MKPTLHQWYSADEAIAAFGGAQSAEILCDGQFVVLPTAVLCLATLGKPATGPYILFPSSFVWKPGRLDYDPADEFPWLPEKARAVWGTNREKIKEHHLFLRAPGDERFLYAGTAHLGSHGNNGIPVLTASTEKTPLERSVWLLRTGQRAKRAHAPRAGRQAVHGLDWLCAPVYRSFRVGQNVYV